LKVFAHNSSLHAFLDIRGKSNTCICLPPQLKLNYPPGCVLQVLVLSLAPSALRVLLLLLLLHSLGVIDLQLPPQVLTRTWSCR